MNKNLTWKQELIAGVICYAISRILVDVLGTIILAAFELVGLLLIVLGIIGAVRALFKKKK